MSRPVLLPDPLLRRATAYGSRDCLAAFNRWRDGLGLSHRKARALSRAYWQANARGLIRMCYGVRLNRGIGRRRVR
jgi:hypothetical protein